MGGFSYQDMAAWDKQGRKKSGGEKLNTILSQILEGNQANRTRGMEDQLMQAKMMDSGFTQQPQQGGMAGLMQKLMGGGQDYQYVGEQATDLDQAKAEYYRSKASPKNNEAKIWQDSFNEALKLSGYGSWDGLDPARRAEVEALATSIYEMRSKGQYGYPQSGGTSGFMSTPGGDDDPLGILK